MPKRQRSIQAPVRGKWFAPPSGGYRGLTANGEVLVRTGPPPKIPATPAGPAPRPAGRQRSATES